MNELEYHGKQEQKENGEKAKKLVVKCERVRTERTRKGKGKNMRNRNKLNERKRQQMK